MKSFAELNLPESVARALRDRNYENAMPVQAAVMDPASAGRDLLVSSQTGSGKTIAFGLALAQTLLGDGATKFARRPQPAALVIVPTRELATQVREELGWLLKHTGMRLASFTGGTPVSGDLSALKQGVDLAIGTPGRLVDLVQRGRLVLGQVAVAVLDEADEMLDLGFREDLETLLKAAPVERRTLLLSATIPSAIRDLARQYQRDALPVDPRAETGGPRSAPHEDIAFVAHLIAGVERRAAVVNVLRASDAERAIVFCTTREGVGELHRYLVARGFTATAISGDRAQAERDRALDQVRRGEARVLVATNVAARGIHLPDVDLIVHADLPLNAESLTHRSGRTGRAGRKGTAVVLATATDRRKAERLLAMANVKATWTAPPSASQIAEASAARLVETLTGDEAAVSGERSARADELLAGLRAKLDDGELLRRLLARELAHLPAGETLRPVAIPAAGGGYGPVTDRAPRSRSEFSSESVMFRVNMGAKDKAEARWLLPLICRRGGVTNRDVGAIRIGPRETVFEISGAAAADFAASAAETDPRAPHIHIERMGGDSRDARDSRGSRAPRPVAPRPSRAPEAKRSEPEAAPRAVPVAEQPAYAPDEAAPPAAPELAPPPPPRAAPAPAATHTPSAPRLSLDEVRAATDAPERDAAPPPRAPVADRGHDERAPRKPAKPAGPFQRDAGAAGPPARRPRDDRDHRGSAKPAGAHARPNTGYGAPSAGPRGARDERPHRAPARAGSFGTKPFASPARHARDERPAVTPARPTRDERPSVTPARHARDERPAATPFHRPAFSSSSGQSAPARREAAPAPRPAQARAPREDFGGRPPHRVAAPQATATPARKSPAPLGARPPAAPPARNGQGHTPAFRARGGRPAEQPLTIERKVHPPSDLRAQPHPRAKPRAK